MKKTKREYIEELVKLAKEYEKNPDKTMRGGRVTRFEQDGDVVTRRIYNIDMEGNEVLYHESTHSAKELDKTAKEIFKYNEINN